MHLGRSRPRLSTFHDAVDAPISKEGAFSSTTSMKSLLTNAYKLYETTQNGQIANFDSDEKPLSFPLASNLLISSHVL